MSNPRLAGRYAKSLVDFAVEQNQLDAVYADIKFLQSINKSNPDFVSMLRSPVIKGDKKGKIVAAVTGNRIGKITSGFFDLLVKKGREADMPEIISAFIDQYNTIKGIHKVKLTTALPVSDEIKDSIVAKVKASANIPTIELESIVDESLIGGFILQAGDQLIDASILRDLKDIKKQFLNNDYIHKLR